MENDDKPSGWLNHTTCCSHDDMKQGERKWNNLLCVMKQALTLDEEEYEAVRRMCVLTIFLNKCWRKEKHHVSPVLK